MRGFWLEDRRLRVRDDLAVPEPPSGEARIRVTLAGLCHTDVELTRGYYPYRGVLGHEFVGVVERAPADPRWEGRRVVGEINATCGTCETCRAGRPTHCERRTVLGIVNRDGAFADYLVLPIANLHAVPDGVTDETAVFTEPVAAAFEVLAQVRIAASDRVVVFGDGKLGQVIAQVLATTGCDLTVVGRHPRKLAHLAARGIATQTDPPPVRRADAVVECTGRREGLQAAAAARHARPQEHLRRRDVVEPVRHRRRRDHRRRVALRTVRAGAGGTRHRRRRGRTADRRPIPAGRRRRGDCARPGARDAEGPAAAMSETRA